MPSSPLVSSPLKLLGRDTELTRKLSCRDTLTDAPSPVLTTSVLPESSILTYIMSVDMAISMGEFPPMPPEISLETTPEASTMRGESPAASSCSVPAMYTFICPPSATTCTVCTFPCFTAMAVMTVPVTLELKLSSLAWTLNPREDGVRIRIYSPIPLNVKVWLSTDLKCGSPNTKTVGS